MMRLLIANRILHAIEIIRKLGDKQLKMLIFFISMRMPA
jgi:hypothetical protein